MPSVSFFSSFGRLLSVLLLALAIGSGLAGGGAAAEEKVLSPEQMLAGIEKQLDKIEARTAEADLTGVEISDLRVEIETVIASATVVRDKAKERAVQLNGLLAALGPAPEDGTAPEPSETRAKRRELEQEQATIDGRVKRAGLMVTRGEQALEALSRLRREQLTADLTQRGAMPLNLDTWTAAVPEALALVRNTYLKAPLAWWDGLSKQENAHRRVVMWLGGWMLAALAFGWPLRQWLLRRFGRREEVEAPGFSRRVFAGLVEGGARGILPAVVVSVVVNGGFRLRPRQGADGQPVHRLRARSSRFLHRLCADQRLVLRARRQVEPVAAAGPGDAQADPAAQGAAGGLHEFPDGAVVVRLGRRRHRAIWPRTSPCFH